MKFMIVVYLVIYIRTRNSGFTCSPPVPRLYHDITCSPPVPRLYHVLHSSSQTVCYTSALTNFLLIALCSSGSVSSRKLTGISGGKTLGIISPASSQESTRIPSTGNPGTGIGNFELSRSRLS